MAYTREPLYVRPGFEPDPSWECENTLPFVEGEIRLVVCLDDNTYDGDEVLTVICDAEKCCLIDAQYASMKKSFASIFDQLEGC